MSLRKSPERTPAFLAAHRRNALKCTGPNTPTGKARSSLNALKHGRFARDLPAKMRAAGVSEVARVLKYRKQISRLFKGKGGQILIERSANTMAISIWREHKVRRKPRFNRFLNKEGTHPRFEARMPRWREEINRMLDEQMPTITEEQLEQIKLKIAQSSGRKDSEQR